MKFEKFDSGNHFSLGVELELRILDKSDLIPRNEFDFVKSNISKEYEDNIAKEFLDSMLEINTPIFYTEKELVNYLKDIINSINSTLDKRNLILHTNGTYSQKCTNVKLSDNRRYQEIYDEHKVLLDNFAICGTHVHIGFEEFDKALKAYNYSIFYLPLLVALSASSIFYNGKNTGIHSYRTKIFERLPKASIPEYFDSYEEMNEIYEILYNSKVIESIKDIWWDVRIQPELKTVEFRVCDALKDFDRMEVIIFLFRAICKFSLKEDIVKMPMQILKQNMWSATRYAMDGKMITKERVVTIKELLKELINKAFLKKLCSKEFYNKALKVVESKTVSQEMLEVYQRTKDLKEVERLGLTK